ncbi:C40 family peptidase [Virgisporangium aliadipatigenens]|uniref:C40 family peptidase n=1 Tax=Virgisporangium aliadipatigenens TaxID=741659 RepID=UPI00194083E4|nr:C40 family peptidase [Virgisporangium aliadipatigenens]
MAAACGLLVAVSIGASAHANPSTAELEKQIDEAWSKLEPTIEEHNRVKIELNANREKANKLADQLKPLEAKIDEVRGKVGGFAVMQYKTGRSGAFNALLGSGSQETFVDDISRLEMMASRQNESIADVVKLRNEYNTQKRALDELVAKLDAQEKDLAGKTVQIEADIKKLNEMRLQAYGTTQGPGSIAPVACPLQYPGGAAGIAVRTACNQVGKSYVFGAEGPNTFDCSGLTKFAWAKAGVDLYHYTVTQFNSTKTVARADLRPADLVFFNNLAHMGMYIGKDSSGVEWMVHAPTTGDVVRLKRVDGFPDIEGFRRPGG